MTKISSQGKIPAFGIKPIQISKQLKINRNTLKSFLAKMKLRATLASKIKLRRGYFTGRVPLNIKTYTKQNPVCKIMDHYGLGCSRRSLEMWLNQNGLSSQEKHLVKGCKQGEAASFLPRIAYLARREAGSHYVHWWNYGQGLPKWWKGVLHPKNKNIVSPVVQQGVQDSYKPVKRIATRWNSAYFMLKQFLKLTRTRWHGEGLPWS